MRYPPEGNTTLGLRTQVYNDTVRTVLFDGTLLPDEPRDTLTNELSVDQILTRDSRINFNFSFSDQEGFLYLHPDGTTDCLGDPFWNATDACCNFCGSSVDDVAFLSAVLDAIEAQFTVDPRRIFLIGHSNGGFMSYRMACEHADRVAAIASLAGATWFDPLDCGPSGVAKAEQYPCGGSGSDHSPGNDSFPRVRSLRGAAHSPGAALNRARPCRA